MGAALVVASACSRVSSANGPERSGSIDADAAAAALFRNSRRVIPHRMTLIGLAVTQGRSAAGVGVADFHPSVDQIVGLVGFEAAVFYRGEDFEDRIVAIQFHRPTGPELR